MQLLHRLNKLNLLNAPKFLYDNTMYATYMGSVAYGVSGADSDIDICGFCIPPKVDLWPSLAGHIPLFDSTPKPFEQYQKHHIKDPSSNKEYDITIFNIAKFFKLCLENNPNFCDMLFVPRNCIIHSTPIAEIVRENRKHFLHKGAYIKFKSYAYSQLHKARIKVPIEDSARYKDYKDYGYSTKFIYHLVRLLYECEQILIEHDLDLQRNKEQLKYIRSGGWSLEQAEEFFLSKEQYLEDLYHKSTLRESPDYAYIKNILLTCLEHHYGSLSKFTSIDNTDSYAQDLKDIYNIVVKYQ